MIPMLSPRCRRSSRPKNMLSALATRMSPVLTRPDCRRRPPPARAVSPFQSSAARQPVTTAVPVTTPTRPHRPSPSQCISPGSRPAPARTNNTSSTGSMPSHTETCATSFFRGRSPAPGRRIWITDQPVLPKHGIATTHVPPKRYRCAGRLKTKPCAVPTAKRRVICMGAVVLQPSLRP